MFKVFLVLIGKRWKKKVRPKEKTIARSKHTTHGRLRFKTYQYEAEYQHQIHVQVITLSKIIYR